MPLIYPHSFELKNCDTHLRARAQKRDTYENPPGQTSSSQRRRRTGSVFLDSAALRLIAVAAVQQRAHSVPGERLHLPANHPPERRRARVSSAINGLRRTQRT